MVETGLTKGNINTARNKWSIVEVNEGFLDKGKSEGGWQILGNLAVSKETNRSL